MWSDRKIRSGIALLLIFCLLIAPALAENGNGKDKIKDKIKDKPIHEKAKIKAQEIAAIKTTGEKVRADKPNHLKYDLLFCQYNPEKNTLQLKFRVWVNGKEKAIHNPVDVYNPPILVVTSSSIDPETGEYTYTSEENVESAIDDIIYRAAMSAPDGPATFDNGDPELWVFPSLDGYIWYNVDGTFAFLRGGVGNNVNTADTSNYITIGSTAVANTFDYMERSALIFDTSGVGQNNVVSAARLDYYVHTRFNQLGAPNLSITGFSPLSNTVLQTADYHNYVDTKYATDQIWSDLTTGQYHNVSLNTNGQNAINKTGLTPIMLRLRWDADYDSTGLVWISGAGISGVVITAENAAGTSQDPCLFITYAITEYCTAEEEEIEELETNYWSALAIGLVSIGAVSIIALKRRRKE